MTEFIERYWLEVLFGLIVAGISALYGLTISRVKILLAEQKAQRAGMVSLLRDRIIQAYNHFMKAGEIPIYELESITDMYNQYHNLCGNGTITKLYNELMNLQKNIE